MMHSLPTGWYVVLCFPAIEGALVSKVNLARHRKWTAKRFLFLEALGETNSIPPITHKKHQKIGVADCCSNAGIRS